MPDIPVAVLALGRMDKAVGWLTEIGVGAAVFVFETKLLPLTVATVVVAAVDTAELTPGAFRVKPVVAIPGVMAEVPRVGPLEPVVAEVDAVAMEEKRVVPALALVLAAAGTGTMGCVAPPPVAAGVAEVKGCSVSVLGWVVLPKEPSVKPEDAVWDKPPLLKEKPRGALEVAVEVVVAAVAELKTKPVDAWLEAAVVVAAATAAGMVPPLSPKPVEAGAGAGAAAAAVPPKFSFGMLTPREKPVPPWAGVVVPKLKPEVWAAGAAGVAGLWEVSENRLVEGVLAAAAAATGCAGVVPKLNLPVLFVEKEKLVAGVVVVVAVFEVPNVNPPVEAPAPPKLNPLMAPALVAAATQAPQAGPSVSATLGRFSKQRKRHGQMEHEQSNLGASAQTTIEGSRNTLGPDGSPTSGFGRVNNPDFSRDSARTVLWPDTRP